MWFLSYGQFFFSCHLKNCYFDPSAGRYDIMQWAHMLMKKFKTSGTKMNDKKRLWWSRFLKETQFFEKKSLNWNFLFVLEIKIWQKNFADFNDSTVIQQPATCEYGTEKLKNKSRRLSIMHVSFSLALSLCCKKKKQIVCTWHPMVCIGHTNNKFSQTNAYRHRLSCAHVQKPTRATDYALYCCCCCYAHVHEHALVSKTDENAMNVFAAVEKKCNEK